jgi:hypothetical protein
VQLFNQFDAASNTAILVASCNIPALPVNTGFFFGTSGRPYGCGMYPPCPYGILPTKTLHSTIYIVPVDHRKNYLETLEIDRLLALTASSKAKGGYQHLVDRANLIQKRFATPRLQQTLDPLSDVQQIADIVSID